MLEDAKLLAAFFVAFVSKLLHQSRFFGSTAVVRKQASTTKQELHARKKLAMTFASSRPCADSNAVEVVAVAIAFEEPFDVPTLQNLAGVLAQNFSDELPGEEQETAQTFAVPSDAAAMEQLDSIQASTELSSVSRFLAQKDGRFSKRIRATEDALIFECFKYTCFKDFLNDADKFLTALLKGLPSDRIIREMGMIAVDAFLYPKETTEETYSTSEIFSENTKYLTSASKSSGLIWHVNQGFFENWVDGKRILQQVNISNGRLQSTKELLTKIEHRSLMRGLNSSVFVSSLNGDLSLESVFTKFHELNIEVLKNLLTDEKRKQINLV